MTDKELLSNISMGCEKSFTHLFNRYNGKLWGYLNRVTRSPEISEEIIQDVFLKIWVNRTMLTNIDSFQGYLFSMAKNHCLNALRSQAREHQAIKRQLKQTSPVLENPMDKAEKEQQLYRLIDEAIDKLPPQQQRAFVLSRHERLKYTEVAERLSLSRETIKKYLQLATQAITNYLNSQKKEILLLILYPLF